MSGQTHRIILLFIFMSVLCAAPSAVEFMGLNASLSDGTVILSWSTASETQNQGYILERKTDSLAAWSPLASYLNTEALVGQGTVSSQTDYSYTDTSVINDQLYYYRISGIDLANNIGLLDSLSIYVGETGIVHFLPADFRLNAYPNPFNPQISILIDQAVSGVTSLDIYDVNGNHVKTLVCGYLAAGSYCFIWQGQGSPSGIYFCRLDVNGERLISKKITLLK